MGIVNMEKIFIGMPVHNGSRFISEAIDSLRKQTYSNWTLLISDNASEDGTAEICKKYCCMDNRITYHRHQKNIGAPANFKYLLDKANSKYFMWAAADDIWQPDFLSSCLRMLEMDKNAGMAFSNIVNIDSFGRVIRKYPSFEHFSGRSNLKKVINYVASPEILGKANIIYSVYRLELCKKAWNASPLIEEWGSDMCFVLAAISRSGGLCIDNRVLFNKRFVRTNDNQGFISEIHIAYPYLYIFPLRKSFEYIKGNLRAVKGTNYFYFVLIIMMVRLPHAFLNLILNIFFGNLFKHSG